MDSNAPVLYCIYIPPSADTILRSFSFCLVRLEVGGTLGHNMSTYLRGTKYIFSDDNWSADTAVWLFIDHFTYDEHVGV